MLQELEGLPDGVVGLQAVGTVTRDDYIRVFEPLVDQARRDGVQIRFLYQFGPEFERFSAGAAWEDARLGFSAMSVFAGCAVVTDIDWIRQSVGFARVFLPYPMRVYGNAALAEAADWLASLPTSKNLRHYMNSELGVMVVEPTGPLTASDFDALALVADPWIAAHGHMNGLVIHAKEFPGWENFGGLVRHVKFIHDHQRKLDRVALATDIKLADIAPQIVEHFVAAEVRHFAYDDLDAASAWAGGGPEAGL